MLDKRCVLKDYARAVVHMREQKNQKRFGLMFGAGISIDFGFPSWNELLQRIAKDSRVSGESMLDDSISKGSISQVLFQKFKMKAEERLPPEYEEYDKKSSYLQAEWHKVIHDALYKDVPKTIREIQDKDTYLKEFLSIIKETRLTINYNFDDTIQLLLSESRTKEERDQGRGFRTVWNSDIQLYPENGVMYHPNGFLPSKFVEKSSDGLIFLENSFGDQLIESTSGHYAALSYHLSQNTCLLVGISLEDSTLKHLLRKNAKLHPGHVHYYIYYLNDINELNEDHKKAITEANFEVYNLVTLFMTKERITYLGQLLSVADEEIEMLGDELGVKTTYRFFLTGSVCAGKSTAVSNFRSLRTHDEWLDERIPGMEKDPSFVDEGGKITEIDRWVAKQWRTKNFILYKAKNPGIDIVDRCPLDAIAFTPEDQWKSKAVFTKKMVTPDHSNTPLCKGRVILLIGNPQTMAVRALKLHKKVTVENLDYRQELLKIIYDSNTKGIIELDTRDKSPQQVSKEISKIIHIQNYEECDLQSRLDLIEDGVVSPPSLQD